MNRASLPPLSEKVGLHTYRCPRTNRSFQLSYDFRFGFVNHKGKLVVARMDRDNVYRTCDIISASDANRLIGWLGAYLNVVRPTTATMASASISAHSRGIERDKNRLLAKACEGEE